MKDHKESPNKSRRHMSVSSRRSIRSNTSLDSHREANARNLFGGRRMSQSSLRSQAIADDSDGDSIALSRKTSHADDSDASGTDESLGETEEDVWFREDIHPDGDINVDELDQLLNLSDEDEEGEPVEEQRKPINQQRLSVPRIVVSPLANGKQPHFRSPSTGSNNSESRPNITQSATPERRNSESVSLYSNKHPRSPSLSPLTQIDQQQPTTANNAGVNAVQGSLLLTNSTNEQFVKYTPAIDEKQGFSELALTEEPFDSSNSGTSSENKDLFGHDYLSPSDDRSFRAEEKSANAGAADGTAGDASRHRRDPAVASASTATASAGFTAGGDGIDDQQSQRFSFYAAGLNNTIHAPDLASLVRENDSFSSLFNPKNGVWFLDCFRPTQMEMRALSRAFGIHPLTVEDIQTEEAREKFEKFSNYYLVVYHSFDDDEKDANSIEPVNFYMLVFNEGVISFHFEPVSQCRSVRRRMRQLKDHLTFTSDWIAYALIDDITDLFAPEIAAIEAEADFVENAVYVDRNSADSMHQLLKRLGLGRRRTMMLLRMLAGKADVVRGFAKRCSEVHNAAGNEMALYLGDIQDHIVTMYQNLSAYEKIFSRTHFNYMGLLQMEFVDSSNQMTSILGKVTVLGTVLLPMNLVTGLFGMNVHIPGQDGPNLNWFFGILAVMLGVMFILLLSGFIYMRWSMKRRLSNR